jgi:hypothetical protein
VSCLVAFVQPQYVCLVWLLFSIQPIMAGPPLTVLEPLRIYQLLRQEWGAHNKRGSSGSGSSSGSSSRGSRSSSNDSVVIKASSFDAFVDAVLDALPTLNLTVVTGEESDSMTAS